ncbi:MAG: fibronectin type III domain-containing protein [Acidobacteria bacterium]|nr:fibronectin type III domain-containing protein [Acidobacteriota bacterium]MBI3655525.1 fibronectin type III domain-containing protein [Acidobacteriota bacterium]
MIIDYGKRTSSTVAHGKSYLQLTLTVATFVAMLALNIGYVRSQSSGDGQPLDANACTPSVPNGVFVTGYSPWSGSPGTEMNIVGSGFNRLPPEARISFSSGTTFERREFTRVSDRELRAIVPDTATSGVVSLTLFQNCPGPAEGIFIGVLRTLLVFPRPFAVYNPPISPSNRRAVVLSDREIDVSWQDNSDNEYGFIIHILEGPSTWLPDVRVPENTQSFRFRNLLPNTRYMFVINAYSEDGESPSLGGERIYATTLTGGTATVTVTDLPNFTNPLCGGNPTSVIAYFDQNQDGKADGAIDTGEQVIGFFPNYVEIGLLLPSGYAVRDGSRYPTNRATGTTSNLIVVARFDCGLNTPQFVAASFALWKPDEQSTRVDAVHLAAGDSADFIGPYRESRGVVMQREGFTGTFDVAALEQLRARGRATGDVMFVSPSGGFYGTMIDFKFEAPILLR